MMYSTKKISAYKVHITLPVNKLGYVSSFVSGYAATKKCKISISRPARLIVSKPERLIGWIRKRAFAFEFQVHSYEFPFGFHIDIPDG